MLDVRCLFCSVYHIYWSLARVHSPKILCVNIIQYLTARGSAGVRRRKRNNGGFTHVGAILLGAGLFVVVLCPFKLLLTIAAAALVLYGFYCLLNCN